MHFNTKYSTTGALAAGHARHRQGMPGCGHWMRADQGGPMWTRADPSGDTGCRPGDTRRAPAEDFTGFPISIFTFIATLCTQLHIKV